MQMQQYQKEMQSFNSLVSQFVQLNTNQSKAQSNAMELSKALSSLTKQSYFLDVVLFLLNNQPYPKDQLILVSSLLKDKFRYDFDSIEETLMLSIYESLCKIISNYQKCGAAVFQNFSLAIAYIYINFVAKSGAKVIQYLRPFTENIQLINYFFKILELIAGEALDSKLVIDDQTRTKTIANIVTQQQLILGQLHNLGPKTWEMKEVKKQHILECFASWIRLNYDGQVMNSLPHHFLLHMVFKCLQEDIEPEASTNCLNIIIQEIKAPHENEHIFLFLGKNIFNLLAKIDQLIVEYQWVDAEYYISMLCQFGSKSTPLFISKFDEGTFTFLNKLIRYLQNQEIDCFNILTQFWQKFLEQYLSSNNPNQSINGIVQQLYLAVCNRCKFQYKLLKELDNITEHALIQCYSRAEVINWRRDDIGPLYQKIAKCLGKEAFLKFVFGCLVHYSNNKQKQELFWPNIQIFIFSLKQPLKNYPKLTENIMLLINSFDQLEPRHILVKRSYLRVFQSLMTLEEKHQDVIKKLFSIISLHLHENLLLEVAERAFCKGCQENADIICKNIEDLFVILKKFPGKSNIIKGVTIILNTRPQLIPQYLPEVLNFEFQIILSKQTNNLEKKQAFHGIITIIKTFTSDKRSKNHLKMLQEIIKVFAKNIWNDLKWMLMNPLELKDDEDPQIQRCIKLLKSIMRFLKEGYAQLLQQTFETLIAAYTKYPICSYIYLLEVAITVFYEKTEYFEYFKSLFQTFCLITYEHLKIAQNYEKYAFLLDDFIGMCKRFFIFNASIVLKSGQLPAILQMCIKAFIGSDAPRVAKASYSFFQTIFMVYWKFQFIAQYNQETDGDLFIVKVEEQQNYLSLKTYLIQEMQYILTKMIEHLIKGPMESTRQCIVDAILSQVKAFPFENTQIWQNILHSIPSDILVRNQKDKFRQNLIKIGSENPQEAKEAEGVLKRHIYILNKRLINANKRMNLES